MNSSPSPEIARLQSELAEKTALVQSIRQELIRSQITVLELQDTILQKETDKADAISILGQAELVLEGEINYIFELDRVLNERIASVQKELADSRAAHETITNDLVQKLDQANRALGDAHKLAARYAQEAAEAREKIVSVTSSLNQVEAAHQTAESKLASVHAEKDALITKLTELTASKTSLEHELAGIHRSFAWKITAPFRASADRKP
ncbi:MAG TPA: hypothetical protein VL069_08195 [Opitutus sp.]|nr:hypothetical protein [Opitutus sp.]